VVNSLAKRLANDKWIKFTQARKPFSCPSAFPLFVKGNADRFWQARGFEYRSFVLYRCSHRCECCSFDIEHCSHDREHASFRCERYSHGFAHRSQCFAHCSFHFEHASNRLYPCSHTLAHRYPTHQSVHGLRWCVLLSSALASLSSMICSFFGSHFSARPSALET